jgi:MFS superfamily sulfate permease-like transporter
LDKLRKGDVIAGLTVAGLILPEAVAYAGIAGLAAPRAILAAVVGCLSYSLVGGSRFAIVSPTSSSAVILAATIGMTPGSVATKAALATVVVALAGLFFLVAAALRLGGLAGFISRPVLRGFAFGLAVTIIIRQLPVLAGVPVHAGDLIHLLFAVIAALPQSNPASLTIGAIALAALLFLRRDRAIPGPFIVLALGIAASALLALPTRGVAVVGTIALPLAWPALPPIGWQKLSRLAQFALPLVLILFAESWGTIRGLALRHGDIVVANRELGALGVANFCSALVNGMPVGAGFSGTMTSEAAGAATRWTGAIAGTGLALLVICAAPAIALLPQPVLAAVVIAALVHSLNPTPFRQLWRINRDRYIALAAAVGVLGLGVLNGMLLAIALSLIALLHRLATPHVARLGRLDDSHNFVDVARHDDAVTPPHIAIFRPTEPLFFANAERIFAMIRAEMLKEKDILAIVLSLEESVDLDSTALEALIEFTDAMGRQSVRVQLARAHDRVRDLLALSANETNLTARCSFSVDDAVEALRPLIDDLERHR